MMLDELQRRNYAQNTLRAYIHAVENFAKYFHRSPNRLGPPHPPQTPAAQFKRLYRNCRSKKPDSILPRLPGAVPMET